MKTQDVRKKNPTELTKLLKEYQVELQEFRFGMAGSAKKNVKRARTLRQGIARIRTVLAESK